MAHLVAYYGRESEIDKFGLVYDVYLYEEDLENAFRANPEREIQAKIIQQGKTFNPRNLNFDLAILELSLARSLPEEYPIVLCRSNQGSSIKRICYLCYNLINLQ